MASGAQELRIACLSLAGCAEPRHLFKIEHAKLKVGLSAGRTGPRIQETFFWDQVSEFQPEFDPESGPSY